MKDDYLWDGSGEPDSDVARLEEILGRLRWSQTKPFTISGQPSGAWISTTENRQAPRVRCPRFLERHAAPRRRRKYLWAAAAAVIALSVGTWFLTRRFATTGPVTSWQLSLEGKKQIAVPTGQVIETAKVTHGTLQSESIGQVDIDPDSRLRLVAATGDRQWLALDHGTIHALIWAPPARFVVDTPSAKTVDLGCQYTLHVNDDGRGFLTVQMGWVAFQWRNLESFIPAGAACNTTPGRGPDTPYFLDAPAPFTKALAQFDSNGSREALRTTLALARPHDGLTLWHLLQRTSGDDRAAVFERFSELVNLPSGINRDAVLRGDRSAMDAAWDALRLGDTSWWRVWKRQW